MLRFTLGISLFSLVACNGNKVEEDDDDGNNSIFDDTGADDTGGFNDPEAPVIEVADAWCYLHKTGDQAYFWVANLEVDDPQGQDTIESFYEGVTVLSSDTELFSEYLVCGDGECTASWAESQYGMACGNAESYTLRFQLTDEDGNLSEPVEVTGRTGTDASG